MMFLASNLTYAELSYKLLSMEKDEQTLRVTVEVTDHDNNVTTTTRGVFAPDDETYVLDSMRNIALGVKEERLNRSKVVSAETELTDNINRKVVVEP
jgi:hypothetical protein